MAVERDAELWALDRSACMMLLRTQPIGRLVVAGTDPRVVPVNFVVVDDTIVLRVEAGSAVEAACGEDVMFEVDMFDERTHSGWSVLARGRMAVADEVPDHALVPWAPGQRDLWMLVTVQTVTGRMLRGAVESPDRAPGGYL
jgi:nitroimidazol reductase NimA-like FMN-containing flavoprotein (pyridoxamine 5'-phosphate oxidase superfamily)